MNVDHSSAREMSDWESFAEMMAAIGVLGSSYISCAWGAALGAWGAGRRDS